MNRYHRKAIKQQLLLALFATLICLLISSILIYNANADMYIGRYDGNVTWAFDSSTGELHIYGDCDVQSPGWSALADHIRSVFIAPGTSRLPNNAFRSCKQLSQIVLPESIIFIGDNAFAGCTSLTALTLPAGVQYIGNDAFSGCESLSSVTYTGTSEQWEQLCQNTASNKSSAWLSEQAPLYTRDTCRWTIVYINEETGERIAPDATRTLTLGASCAVPSPEIKDFAPGESVVFIQNARTDRTVTVRYHRTHCTVRVHYLNEKGEQIVPTQSFSVAYGAALTVQAPTVTGYELPDQPTLELSQITKGELEHTFTYTARLFSVTVSCLDENGTPLCQPLTLQNLPYGSSYHMMLPTISGHTAPVTSIEGSNLTDDVQHTVCYTAIHYPVTLAYVDEQGQTIAPPDIVSVRYGAALSSTPPDLSGFSCKQQHIHLAAVTAEQHVTVVYQRLQYALIVRHEASDGTLLGETVEYVAYEQPYRCTPLSKAGYTVEPQSEKVSGTMPASSLTVTLRYQANSTSQASPDLTPNGTTWLWASIALVAVLVAAAVITRRRLRAKEALPQKEEPTDESVE